MLCDTVREIRSSVEAIESDAALYQETSFSARRQALDFLEFHVVDRIEGLLLRHGCSGPLVDLRTYAETVRARVDAVDERLFRRLRDDIASGHCTTAELWRRIAGCRRTTTGGGSDSGEGYDELDALVDGLLFTEVAPEGASERDPEMVDYQPTPARVVVQMVEGADFRPDDVFFDIGSGLGHVPILVHLLSGVRTKGVEIEFAYCEYARRRARELNLSQVQFIHADAREADYSDGTFFFLYTPFEGKILDRVMERLGQESRRRKIRLCTYGPCSRQADRQRWLERLHHNSHLPNQLAVFASLE